jgi:hypothetical protein
VKGRILAGGAQKSPEPWFKSTRIINSELCFLYIDR